MNCGAAVHGRFCHVCGQENIEPKESFWHLVTHFIYDVTHFDGKFFSTLRYLLFKPGFLSNEYLRGRRASYLHPIRMYVFTSAFFFLVFFSVNKEEDIVKLNESQPTAAKIVKKLEKERKELLEELKDTLPELARKPILQNITMLDSDIALIKRDTTAKDKLQSEGDNFNMFNFSGKKLMNQTVASYDSVQKALPVDKRDNFIEGRFERQNLHLKEKYHNDNKAIWTAILDKFKHLFPQMLFVSLPLFALLLKLLYVRRKNFFYVNHVVFTIHLYCGTFIIILLGMLAEYLAKMVSKGTGEWTAFIFTMLGLFYLYKSLRNFYEQRRAKTVLKYMLLFFFSIFIMAFLFTLFFIFSAMAI